MKRVFLTVLDAVGCGELPDAASYGDEGADTLRHVIGREHPALPNLTELGLGNILGQDLLPCSSSPCAYGKCAEKSAGKDTTTGHWEIGGVPVMKPFPTFPEGFPDEFIEKFQAKIGHKVIGNKPASGTAILEELGEEHIRTGCPIVYTSADSVFQIACHEEIYSREKLYEMCVAAREMLQGDLGVGRVIARPFVGRKGEFVRTSGRRDFSLPPIGMTILDDVSAAGLESLGVGKIEDIFEHRGLTGSNHAAGNPACIDAWVQYMRKDFSGICFTNLVDTDMLYGHRRDTKGFAGALEEIDRSIPLIKSLMKDDDLLVITADHGCDPTFHGTDHTREYIPLMVWTPGMKTQVNLGTRSTYSDIAATCAQWLGLEKRYGAESFCDQLI